MNDAEMSGGAEDYAHICIDTFRRIADKPRLAEIDHGFGSDIPIFGTKIIEERTEELKEFIARAEKALEGYAKGDAYCERIYNKDSTERLKSALRMGLKNLRISPEELKAYYKNTLYERTASEAFEKGGGIKYKGYLKDILKELKREAEIRLEALNEGRSPDAPSVENHFDLSGQYGFYGLQVVKPYLTEMRELEKPVKIKPDGISLA